MFVRELKNVNGRTYIQVVSKTAGKYKVLKSFGGARDRDSIQRLISQAQNWINLQKGNIELDLYSEIAQYTSFTEHISGLKLAGIELLLGNVFDQIGFSAIEDELFKSLVLYRLVYPRSKLKTTEYLFRYEHKEVSVDTIYRYMDKLHSSQKDLIQQISYTHTREVLKEAIQIVFYDVTTIYFEIDREDDLRKTGFSKEGKHQHPQIVLGLLVSMSGYPLAYDIFEGNQFEGKTMLPVIEAFKKKFHLEKLLIVADSGLLSKEIIALLIEKVYEFLLGARIKNESQLLKEKILALSLKDNQSKVLRKGELRLIVSYSERRAKKDAHNRERGLKRLEKRLAKGKLTKAHLNQRGYNKYLILDGDVKVSIDYNKYNQDAKWDGLKGYITNSSLSKDILLAHYRQLWQIEKAFRIAKSELNIRPVFHRLQKRIEAHICLCFAAYKVYKELERQLLEKNADISPAKAIEIAQSIFEIEIITPNTKQKIAKVLLLKKEQKVLAQLFQFGC